MISVIIPLYNKAHTILGTLNSVLDQNYSEWELIIVNDGSTDDGAELIRKLTHSDSRVRVFDQPNQGVSAARNKGVALAKYEYVAFLDGDDIWRPGYLTKMKEAIEMFPNAGMYCSAGIIRNADGSQNYRLANKYKNKILEIDFFENPHVFVHTSATIVSKQYFNKTIGFPLNIWDEDFYLFFSLALIAKVVYSGHPLSVYIGGVEGQATSRTFKADGSILKNPIPRHNLLFQNWNNEGCKNRSFIVFLKYELRHSIKILLVNKNYVVLEHYFDHLSPEIQHYFRFFEKPMYLNTTLRKLAILFILVTKLRWRMRGYPRIDIKSSRCFSGI